MRRRSGPGALADVTEAIAAKGVNIISVSGATCGDRGRVAIATEDNAQTRAAGLRVPSAIGDFLILDAIRESGGLAVAVEEADIDIPVDDEMSDSFLQYSLSVITSRAIPDVREAFAPIEKNGKISYAPARIPALSRSSA